MKCDDCLNLLETYLDGEAGERNGEHVREHLMKCTSCTSAFEALTAENELFARYDRELEISPAIWNGIEARIAAEGNGGRKSGFSQWFAGLLAMPSFRFAAPAVAFALIAIVIGVAYWRTRPERATPGQIAGVDKPKPSTPAPQREEIVIPATGTKDPQRSESPLVVTKGPQRERPRRYSNDQQDVLVFGAGYSDMEEKDTATHLSQAENLLISVRSIEMTDDDQEVDVSYEKAESRRLLNENIILRRDAEMAGKFPAKSVLGSLEPFLIDIANLPDKAPAKDLRQIRDRVQKTEIVAELRGYE
jgi:hypothetical protein